MTFYFASIVKIKDRKIHLSGQNEKGRAGRKTNARVFLDCRDLPNENDCTLYISGSKKEVLTAAIKHSIEEHGHKDTPELRKQLNSMLQKESKHKKNSGKD